MSDAAYVAVDCGSNSLRMLAVDEHGTVVDRYLATTRLGRSIPSNGLIDQPAMAAAVAALAEIKKRAGVATVAAVATSAVRDAANADHFLGEGEAVLGTPLQVLSGVDEGRLTFSGATTLGPRPGAGQIGAGDPAQVVTVIDVGGGSTEVSSGRPGGSPAVRSFQTGCVRLAQTHFAFESRDADAVVTAARAVRVLLDDLAPTGSGRVVAAGGTATTIAAYSLKLSAYRPGAVDGHELTLGDLAGIRDELAALTTAERRRHPHLAEGRADVVIPGVVILLEVLNRLAAQTCVTSERGILEGLLFDRFGVHVDHAGHR